MLLNGDRRQSPYFAQVLAIGIQGRTERRGRWRNRSRQDLAALQKAPQAADRVRYPLGTTAVKLPALAQLLRRQQRQAALFASPEILLNGGTSKQVTLARRVPVSLPK